MAPFDKGKMYLAEGRDLAEKSQRIVISYFGIVRANKSEVNDQMSRC
jgi:hypothetical protein